MRLGEEEEERERNDTMTFVGSKSLYVVEEEEYEEEGEEKDALTFKASQL